MAERVIWTGKDNADLDDLLHKSVED